MWFLYKRILLLCRCVTGLMDSGFSALFGVGIFLLGRQGMFMICLLVLEHRYLVGLEGFCVLAVI